MATHHVLAALGVEDRTYTLEEWEAVEQRTGEKFEYHAGRLVPWRMMAGGSAQHSQISGNLAYTLGVAVRNFAAEHPALPLCNVHSSDLRIKVQGADRYLYPDVAIVCGKPSFDARITTAITNPVVIVEVLSPSSIRYDMGEKFAFYSQLDSLREYVLVEQADNIVEVRSRAAAGANWTPSFAKALDHEVHIPSLGLALPMREVYRGVEFDDAVEYEVNPAPHE